ncbi:hypothetical protein GQX74_014279 [Glossina fuscipes]|nr:hypothetical protein GQX74_014279 [Glossina fuscipes]
MERGKKPTFLTETGCMEQFHGVGNLSPMEQMILQNKENIVPQAIKSSTVDGCLKKQNHNNSIEIRLPLSPIEGDAAITEVEKNKKNNSKCNTNNKSNGNSNSNTFVASNESNKSLLRKGRNEKCYEQLTEKS